MAKKEKTISYAVCAVVVCAIIAVCVVSNMGSGEKREKEMKKLLANNWYRQWSESVSFTLYDMELLRFQVLTVKENGHL